MPERDDAQLLAEFTRNESETAFATLVTRYVNLVYSTALRFTRNPHHAEEITQAVFVILARKAGGLGRSTVLSGWLYQAARLTAANFMKSEARRQRREQEAYMQSTLNDPDATWELITPMLDEAMGGLGEADRNAIVLRFFENRNTAEVAAALKTTEAAVHKRTHRALEKLRKIFTKRGVTLSSALIAGAVSANSVQGAPIGLAAMVSATAAKGAAISGSTITFIKGALKLMAWTKAKMAIVVGVSVFITVGTTVVTMQKMKRSRIDTYLSDRDLNDFKTAPPLVHIQPTRWQNKPLYPNAKLEFGTGKMAGRHVWLKFIIERAYEAPDVRIIFPPDQLLTNYFDFLVTTTEFPHEKLQTEITKQTGYTARNEIREGIKTIIIERLKN